MELYRYLGQISQESRYQLIYPILTMLAFHVDGDEENVFCGGKKLNNTASGRIKLLVKRGLYIAGFLGRKRRETGTVTLISSSLLNDRYEDLCEDVLEYKNVKGAVTLIQCNKQMFAHREFFRRGIYFNDGVASRRTTQLVHECFEHIRTVKSRDMTCDDAYERTEALYDRLSVEVRKDIDRLKKKFLKHQVFQYITISTQSLLEIIMVMACKECGIETKEIVHASTVGVSPDNEIRRTKNVYTNKIYLWNESEIEYFNKYNNYRCRLYPSVQLRAMGSPEASYKKVSDSLSKYPMEQRITLFVPDIIPPGTSYTKFERGQEVVHAKMRKNVYEKFSTLSKVTGMKVCIRYHPGLSKEIISYEEAMVKELGLINIPPEDESLAECICKSHSVFGSITSALVMACVYGTRSYDFRLSDETVDYCGVGVKSITLENMECLDFQAYEKRVRKEYCYNLALLMDG